MAYYQYTRLHGYVRYGVDSTCEVVDCAITELLEPPQDAIKDAAGKYNSDACYNGLHIYSWGV